jgi:transcriptional repressor NrdR
VLEGLLRACEKRPVPIAKLAEVVDTVESMLAENPEREVSTASIGEMVLERLKKLDKIAYVRFASVYKDFQDAESFMVELKDLFRDAK